MNVWGWIGETENMQPSLDGGEAVWEGDPQAGGSGLGPCFLPHTQPFCWARLQLFTVQLTLSKKS